MYTYIKNICVCVCVCLCVFVDIQYVCEKFGDIVYPSEGCRLKSYFTVFVSYI